MKERVLAGLSRADQRLVWGGMILVIALLAFEGWHLVLRTPCATYRQLHENRVALAAAIAAADAPATELGRLAAEVQALNERLKDELHVAQSDEQLTAFLMAELDRSAAASGALLKAVKPGIRRPVATFEEISYEVTAEGNYLPLTRWLMNLERELGRSAGASDFSMKAAEGGQVAVTLKLALYRPAPAGSPAK